MSAQHAPVEGKTIGEVLRDTAQQYPQNEAVVFPSINQRYTWAELDNIVDQTAKGLLAAGFKKGDHFGVWATNCPAWIILQLATARIGVVLVTINPGYRSSELAYTLAQSEVRGLAIIDQFKTSDYPAMLYEVCSALKNSQPGSINDEKLPNLKHVYLLRGKTQQGMSAWNNLLTSAETISDAQLQTTEALVTHNDPINLQYTSGTTGSPKGALLSHRNILLNAHYASEGQKLTNQDRICIPVPLYHCFGCVLGTLCALVQGAAMIFPSESFEPEATLDAIESEKCTAIYGVPTMFIAELEHPTFPQRDTTTLRTGIMAGSPCPIELMKRVTSGMGASEITIAYGQTEASPLITMTRTDDPLDLRVGTVGQCLPDVDVKIVDTETGNEVGDNESGELCCRGHNVMDSYYNMPKKTAESIDSEGWLHTGDLALRQPDGYFRITGRLKDMIIRGGENIAPREVEERLHEHPEIEDVQVVGLPDAKLGEQVLACIKLRTANSITPEEIREFCREKLSHFKVPKYVLFLDSFPTTVTGKIQKFKLRDWAIKELNLQSDADIETA